MALVARCREAQAQGDVVGLSAITVSELEFAAYNSGDYDTEIVAVRKILVAFEFFDCPARDHSAWFVHPHPGQVHVRFMSLGRSAM